MFRASFLGFETAKRALGASQMSLDVTGQNISNVNTEGYTRQRADLVSCYNNTTAIKYSTYGESKAGTGVWVNNINQVRDPFLDRRFRDNVCDNGEATIMNTVYNDLEAIFSDMASDELHDLMGDFVNQLQSYLEKPTEKEIASVVSNSASKITTMINNYASQLATVKEQQVFELTSVHLKDVNTTLDEIAALNKQIKETQLYGSNALELIDQRNLLIDSLAKEMDVRVTETEVPVGNPALGVSVNELKITLRDNPDVVLVEDDTAAKFYVNGNDPSIESASKILSDLENGEFKISLSDINSPPANPSVIEMFNIQAPDDTKFGSGTINGYLKMLSDDGSFGGTTERGIPYYEKMLDAFAQTLANSFNKLNVEGVKNPDGTDLTQDQIDHLRLFTSTDGELVKASNIRVSEEWQKNPFLMLASDTVQFDPTGDFSSQGQNDKILKFIEQMDADWEFTYQYVDPTKPDNIITKPGIFKGSSEKYLTDFVATLGIDTSSSKSLMESTDITATNLDLQRQSLSAVSLDEEGINLLTYSKSYNAAARLMTTLDEALDTIINNMGRVGR